MGASGAPTRRRRRRKRRSSDWAKRHEAMDDEVLSSRTGGAIYIDREGPLVDSRPRCNCRARRCFLLTSNE